MKPGDHVEFAIWLTGEETEDQVRDFKTVQLEKVRLNTERQHLVEIGPWEFTIKRPGEERVPPVPDHVHGPDVRLLIAEAKVGNYKRPVIVKQSGFVEDLTKEDKVQGQKWLEEIGKHFTGSR